MNEIGKEPRSGLSLEPGNLIVIGSALLLAAGAFFWRLHILRVRYFNTDELEHLHAAWCISKGLVPYRDFFEHHTPGLHFFFAPFFRFFDVDTKVADAQAFIFFARTWMWIFTGLILGFTVWLGRLWRGAPVGCVAALFLGNTLMFLEKTIEVRPDVLSAALWLGCLVLVIRGIREEETGWKPRWRFALSGMFLGAAVLCTQKMLFALPGLGLAMLWYLLDPRSRGTGRQRFWNVASQALGFCVPILVTLGYFAIRGALGEFLEYNFFINLRWKTRFPPYYYLKELAKENTVLVFLAVVGFFCAVWGMFGQERFRRAEFVFVLSALGLFGGLFLIQMPWQQYFLTFLPLGAVFASSAFLEAMDWIVATVREERERNARSALYIFAGTSVLAALVILAMKMSRTHSLNDLLAMSDWVPRPFHAALWLLALGAAAFCILIRRENLAAAALFVGVSLYPFNIMRTAGGTDTGYHFHDYTNTSTLNEIRYVIQNTSPTDVCMDGWTGLGVFRPHAWFYWHLPGDVREMMSAQTKNEFAVKLQSGSMAPILIFYDQDLKGLTPETAQYFEKHYEPTGVGSIWRRRE